MTSTIVVFHKDFVKHTRFVLPAFVQQYTFPFAIINTCEGSMSLSVPAPVPLTYLISLAQVSYFVVNRDCTDRLSVGHDMKSGAVSYIGVPRQSRAGYGHYPRAGLGPTDQYCSPPSAYWNHECTVTMAPYILGGGMMASGKY